MRRRKTVIRLRAVALHPEREAGRRTSHPSPQSHCLHSDSLHLPPRTSFLLLLSGITTNLTAKATHIHHLTAPEVRSAVGLTG